MAPLKVLASVAAVAVLFHCALAATITVGAPNGSWDQATNYQTWASSQKFTAGDTLLFQYTSNHDVVEVTKSNYDACQASSPIKTYTGGNTAITLPTAGKRYFICGTLGHCAGGMKLEVNVVSAASAPPPATPATPPSKSAPSPKAPQKSPSPSSSTPEPPASPVPSGSPTGSPPSSPSPSGSTTPPAPSAAVGLKASAAAGFLSGLLMLLAF